MFVIVLFIIVLFEDLINMPANLIFLFKLFILIPLIVQLSDVIVMIAISSVLFPL